MKKPFLAHSTIELLEARIAPALLVSGANLLGGAGNPNSGETSVGDHSVTLVKVLSGQALVWFDNGSISSVSFGPNTNLEITGDIFGDLVGNLTAAGELSDSDANPLNGEDGSKLLANNLVGLKTLPLSGQKGSLENIITGGSINGLSINGELLGAYAGDGAFRTDSDVLSGGQVASSTGSIDINPVAFGTQATFLFTQAGGEFRPGASISNAKITSAPALQLFAGSGNPTGAIFAGPGPAGGSITGVTIDSAFVPAGAPNGTPSYALLAGDGANGKSGGAGGSIDRVIEKTSSGPVILNGGQGGTGAAGAGGAGGSVSNLDLQSNSARYLVTAGDGGEGAPAGDGGRLFNNNFSNRTPVSGIILAGDFTGDDRDDVLVVDAATGQMIISTQGDFDPGNATPDGDGVAFRQIVQFRTLLNEPVALIDAGGVGPVDAIARDVDGDGDLDILVAYKSSSSLGIFLNQGDGTFFDPNLGTAGEFAVAKLSLGFAPVKIAANSSVLAIAENTNGKGLLHYGSVKTGSGIDELTIDLSTGSNEFSQPVADLVAASGEFYAAFTNGVISRLQTAGLEAKKPFAVFDTGVAIPGGITDLETDFSGNRLLALSATSRTVSVFDTANSNLTLVDTILLSASGKPLVAHFVHDADLVTEDRISVLTSLPTGTRLSEYVPAASDNDPATNELFAAGTIFTSTATFKNFAPAYDTDQFIGDAALAGSMSQFTFTPDLVATAEYALPFASKLIEARAGQGGEGLNLGTLIGKGGAGGSILGINADANEIKLYAGDGGASSSGPAGAGGSVINPASFLTSSAATVVPTLLADVVLVIEAGDGGAPNGPGAKTANGGAGGSLGGLNVTLDSGDITLSTGSGGHGDGGNGGAGGNFSNNQTLARDGSLTVSTGAGGNATGATGFGGAGGAIVNFRHELALSSDVEQLEKAYTVSVSTGAGGTSVAAAGGAGGAISGLALKLDGSDQTYDDGAVTPPLVDANKDNTVRIVATTGAGGEGAIGGAGGAMRDLSSETVHDQVNRFKQILLNFVTMSLTAGAGGDGTAGAGGVGGSITFTKAISGITQADPDAPAADPFVAIAGAGGDGTLKGGAGGGITGLTLQNSPFADGSPITTTHLVSAILTAGNGGAGGTADGGAGGAISKVLAGVQGGSLAVTAGTGGDSAAAKGGVGGAVSASSFGLVKTFSAIGLRVDAGAGGDGPLGGGSGGAIAALQVSTPQSTNGISAIIYAGQGGAANAAKALGGKGGDVTGLTQNKDVNSSINVVAAGIGGANPLGAGGAGGNVVGVKTVGFLGRPSDGLNRLGVFDEIDYGGGNTDDLAQGVFSGIGGTGLTKGANGSVSNIAARQIGAIAAYNSTNFTFAAAAKVSNVKASLIGFDVNQNGIFNSDVLTGRPIDGFIRATVLDKVSVLPPAGFIFTV